MKAKEYAEKIISESEKPVGVHETEEAYFEVWRKHQGEFCINILIELMKEIKWDALSKRLPSHMFSSKSDDVVAAKFRELLTKWKSIVSQVKSKVKDHSIDVNFFGLLIASQDPVLFETLKNKKIFLGYDFTPREKQILANLELERQSENFLDQLRKRIFGLLMQSYVDVHNPDHQDHYDLNDQNNYSV